jgi:hypothetical protein
MRLVELVRSGVVGFFRFWYHFIIGDDWKLAGTVVVGLLLTAILNAQRLPAWWAMPVVAILGIAASLRLARLRT